MNPTESGFYLFRGTRRIRNNQYIRVREPVELATVLNRGEYEFAVFMIGRQLPIPLACLEGEWERIEVQP